MGDQSKIFGVEKFLYVSLMIAVLKMCVAAPKGHHQPISAVDIDGFNALKNLYVKSILGKSRGVWQKVQNPLL